MQVGWVGEGGGECPEQENQQSLEITIDGNFWINIDFLNVTV